MHWYEFLDDQRYIYVMVDPISREIVYIGQTDDVERRLEQHRSARYGQVLTAMWLDHLGINDLEPEIMVIAIDARVIDGYEKMLIQQCWAAGHPLMNTQFVPVFWSQKMNRLIQSEANKRMWFCGGTAPTEEWKQNKWKHYAKLALGSN